MSHASYSHFTIAIRCGLSPIGSFICTTAAAILFAGCTAASPASEVGASQQALRVAATTNGAVTDVAVRLAAQADLLSKAQAAADTSEQKLHAALTSWTDQLRAALAPGMHTVVEGLVDDSDCAGDIVADRLFEHYFDALFTKTDDQRANIIAALSVLARQSACLGSRQSAFLASTLYATYNQVRDQLHQSGADDVIPYLADAASQPLVLFYDVEKYRGAKSPLARWFAENREYLTQGVLAKRHPAMWHGLWLYDRRSGHLLGYKHTLTPRDENDVDLTRFWSSIASMENLGDYTCSFMEMLGRGADSSGYFCGGSKCAKRAAEAEKNAPSLAETSASLGKSPVLGASEQNPLPTSSDNCDESSPGGGDGASGGVCGQGLGIGGDSFASQTINCLTSQIVRPGTEMMKCVSEAMGLCSNPVDKFTKELRQAEFAGVKVGTNCQISAGMGDVKAAEQKKQDEAAADVEKKKQDADKAQAAAEAALKVAEENEKKAQQAKEALDAAEKAGTATQADRNGAWLLSALAQLSDAAYSKAVSDMQAADKAYMDAKNNYNQNYGTGAQRCPIDTPECGNNNCSGMSDSMRQTLDCVKKATEADSRDPFAFQRGGCDPKVCDPIDAAPGARTTALSQCFAPMDNGVDAAVTKHCWAVDCAQGTETALSSSGMCNCQPPQQGSPDGHLRGMCDTMYCAEGSPKAGPTGCTCDGSTSVPVSPPSGGGTINLPGSGTQLPNVPGNGNVPVTTQPGQPTNPGQPTDPSQPFGPWPH